MSYTIVKRTVVGTSTTFEYLGKSTDVKPNSSNGSKFTEWDTGKELYFDGDEQGWSERADKYLVSIKVTTAPTKVAYVEGDTFDATGMVVKAVYDDTTEATITSYDVIVADPLTVNDTSVTIKYVENGRTRTVKQEITVDALALSSIAYTTDPTKVAYSVGETLDLTGAVVTATYNNSDTKDVTEQCTFAPADGATLTAEDTSVVATYTEGEVTKTASVSLTIT